MARPKSTKKQPINKANEEVKEQDTVAVEETDVVEDTTPVDDKEDFITDISDVLAEETKVKNFTPPKNDDEEEVTQEKTNDDDFDSILDEEEPKNDEEDPGATNEENADKNTFSAKDNAEVILGTLDSFFQLVLPFAYSKKMFTEKEKEHLPEIKAVYSVRGRKSFEGMFNQLPDEDKILYDKYLVYKESCDAIPFSKQETRHLSLPLEAVLKKHGWDTGPEASLFMALFMITGSRLTPFIS